MKGYKAFDNNLKCRDMQYKIGETYEFEGELKVCDRGFHFCETIADCYEYYPKSEDTRICEIEALGEIQNKDNKYCTNKIKIIRELYKEEHNNGNIGVKNCGYSNKGNYNEGDSNKGNCNKGDSNKGDCNKGNYNEGDYNEGDYNIGIMNKGNYLIGIANTKPTPFYLFNKPCPISYEELTKLDGWNDLLNGRLTNAVRALPNFDEEIWNEIMGE